MHGDFTQMPNRHATGCWCIKCSGSYNKKDEVIINAKKVHKNKYAYSLMTDINNTTVIKIMWPTTCATI